MLTPLHLEILVWYHGHAEDMPNMRSPAVMEYISQFVQAGILERASGEEEAMRRSWRTTEKGDAFLGALLMVPYPVQKWEVQWPRP